MEDGCFAVKDRKDPYKSNFSVNSCFKFLRNFDQDSGWGNINNLRKKCAIGDDYSKRDLVT